MDTYLQILMNTVVARPPRVSEWMHSRSRRIGNTTRTRRRPSSRNTRVKPTVVRILAARHLVQRAACLTRVAPDLSGRGTAVPRRHYDISTIYAACTALYEYSYAWCGQLRRRASEPKTVGNWSQTPRLRQHQQRRLQDIFHRTSLHRVHDTFLASRLSPLNPPHLISTQLPLPLPHQST